MNRRTFLPLVRCATAALLACAAACSGPSPQPTAEGPAAAVPATASTCQPVTAQQIYRFIAGQDTCMTQMSQQQITAELNDSYATLVLRPNAGGQGPWPDTVADIVTAINEAAAKQNLNFQQFSYMVGEGSQITTSVTPRDSNRDLRYVITWGPTGQTPVIFLSALPAGTQGGTPPLFLQVISFNPQNGLYNYYQYVNNQDVNDGGPGGTETWSWAGNGGLAFQNATAGQGCFGCHRNGGLNMKELTAPWNNWNSTQALINPANVPVAVTQDPLFQNLTTAAQLQNVFQSAMFQWRKSWIASSIQNGTVSNVGTLLAPLFVNTTVNFAESQTLSSGTGDISSLPNDFFLADSILSGVLGLSYQVPALTLGRTDYNNFLTQNAFKLVNTDMTPDYSQPGATYFSFFVPVPAYEDVKAVQQLIQQQVITSQFAAAALMVDFQNPVFSQVRQKLLPYAQQVTSGTANGQDIPNQIAALITAAAKGQPACDTSQLSQCTPEQQFLFYWNASSWQTAATGQIQPYLNAVGQQIATSTGVSSYMTLAVSRGIQFSNWPGICNLHEFSLLLPQTSLGNVFVQMDVDGTTSSQVSYDGCGAPAAAAAPETAEVRPMRSRAGRGHNLRARGGPGGPSQQ